MTVTSTSRRPSLATRRGGYVVSVLLNGVLLVGVNAWPGWQAVPFLTADTALVIGLVNASIVMSLIANGTLLVRDPRWLKALGDMATTSLGLAAVLRLWDVFPFDFGTGSVDWPLLTRIVLVVAIAGSLIGLVAALVTFLRTVGTRSAER
jgi:hypothetical protein